MKFSPSILIILAFGFLVLPAFSQDEIPGEPDGIYSLSPEAQEIYESEIFSSEPMTEQQIALFENMMSSCETAAPMLRATFRRPDIELPDAVTVENLQIGERDAAWFIPEGASEDKILFFIHGGAFVAGSLDTYTPFLMWLAEHTGYRILSPEYRLAPEYPYPAATQDVESAYNWLLEQGYSPDNIAIAGDSAGGNLSLQLLLSLRDAGDEMPAAVWLYAAAIDFTRSAATETDSDIDNPLSGLLQNLGECYLGEMDATDPRVSPIFADLSGLPPMYISVGTREGGLGVSTRLARIGRNAGVDVTLDVWDGMWHVWSTTYSTLPESVMLHQSVARWLDGIWSD